MHYDRAGRWLALALLLALERLGKQSAAVVVALGAASVAIARRPRR